MLWLGLDTGTGSTRALLLNGSGNQVAAFSAPHEEMRMDHPGWAEQRPDDWVAAAAHAIQGVLSSAGVRGADIQGIGLSGQMHGLVLLDDAGSVIRPSLIWCDQRSQPQVDFINRTLGPERVVASIANPVLTGFTLPKLLWVRDHEPRNFERMRHILLPKDYVRYWLTGGFATEVSDASGTALLDVVRRQWSTAMLDGLGLDRSLLPRVHESVEITGVVSQSAAKLTGLKAGTPVVGGGGDQAASAVGNGVVRSGIASCTLGTSGVVFAHTDAAAWDAPGRVHTFCHAVPEKWHVMGVTQGAGLSLQWLRNQLMPGASYDALTAEASQAPTGSQGLFWLPYLMGERTPHLDSTARGGWIGLTARHTRADLIRSVIEGVCYSQKDCLRIIESLGIPVNSIRISGGGARSRFWRQTLADVFEKPVASLENQEGSAFGAALLAMTGTGAFASVSDACDAGIRETGTLEPRETEAVRYREMYEIYHSLYPALRPAFSALAAADGSTL
jgi:xylulokinase